jgi:hypothetical protein
MVLLMSFTACEQKELYLCPPAGNIPINVMIHWDNLSDNLTAIPKEMTVHWYPTLGPLISSDMSASGGREWLNTDKYNVMCLDFHGNTTLEFRSNGTREDFEVYNIRMTGLYNTYVPQLPGGEITVAEANPYRFYIDSRPQIIETQMYPGDSLTVHFYPQNALREFTFLVYDVVGASYMAQNSGAISGMSGSYFPASGQLASTPSTILFSRVEAIPNGQTNSRWTDRDKTLFTTKDSNWANPDTLTGWTRDWITGKFVTFGPLNTDEHRFRLTVEAISKANNYFNASWGYWHGEWENTVAAQIDSAMGKNGTPEEQLAWRQRNGGYDIILYNDNRLVVPASEGNDAMSNGGFTVTVDDWGEMIDVPTSGTSTNVGAYHYSPQYKAPVNTYATIPDFVVNGKHNDGGNWSRIFNEQYVYKPESGLIWDYAPKKYWPPSGEIDFYAYAPAGIKNKNLITGLSDDSNESTPPVLEYTLSYKERDEPPPGTGELDSVTVDDKQEDLLVAVQNRESPQTAPVPMHFRHAFSRVTVKAKTDQDYRDYRIKVTRVDLRNLYINGKLPLNPDTGSGYSNGIPMAEAGAGSAFQYNGTNKVTLWNDLDTLAYYRFKLHTSAIPIEDDYTTLLLKNDGIFVIPQPVLSNTAIYVEYDIYKVSITSGEKYYKSANKLLQFKDFSPGFTFEIGRQYELRVTLVVP